MGNKQLVLRKRPQHTVTDDCFELIEKPIPSPGPGEILVRTLTVSCDPAQRGWLNDIPSYLPPVALGAVMQAWGLGEVVVSCAPGYAPGDLVTGWLGWQAYALLTPEQSNSSTVKVPSSISDPTWMLTVAGWTGLAAYIGMTEIGELAPGDTVLVTAAAGATGSVAGQIARILGARRIIGTAGSEAKRHWSRERAGFDECIDHYDQGARLALGACASDGYDVVFDNVGGKLLDAALFNLAHGARVVLCGAISTGYRPERPSEGLHYYPKIIERRARIRGYVIFDWADRFADAQRRLIAWAESGAILVEVDTTKGLEQAPSALRRLFTGAGLGKQLVQVATSNEFG